MARTDIYRPSAIVPDEYYDIAFLPHGDSMGDCMARRVEIEKINAHMAKTGGHYAQHEHGGSCDVCGNVQALTHVIFYHAKSNTYIRVGCQCADKIGLGYDKNGMNVFKTAMREATALKAGKAKAQAVLAGLDLSRAWEIWQARQDACDAGKGTEHWQGMTRGQQTIEDMVSKLVRYGSLSEKQVNFLRSLVVQEAGDVSKMNARQQARHEADQRHQRSQHIGTVGERREFTAVVRFAKYIETQGNRFSDGFTITIMDEVGSDNVIVWMGKGFDHSNEIKGATVTFKATIKAHDERENVKQTKVTRCKAISVALAPAEKWAPEAIPADLTPRDQWEAAKAVKLVESEGMTLTEALTAVRQAPQASQDAPRIVLTAPAGSGQRNCSCGVNSDLPRHHTPNCDILDDRLALAKACIRTQGAKI